MSDSEENWAEELAEMDRLEAHHAQCEACSFGDVCHDNLCARRHRMVTRNARKLIDEAKRDLERGRTQ